ncbi:hypothetical protein Pmani_015050 [Petrolisthes manimaculis]|uniref:Reverse transcriptase domain-containing protein n=1 Tax=Petrolisthes manimaculis TaxID=1843537 RepID=A0AAE1PUQ5_9EUCA|nr:hypothetical protein Pmani_015050 [Petrolisthes manimaculis]
MMFADDIVICCESREEGEEEAKNCSGEMKTYTGKKRNEMVKPAMLETVSMTKTQEAELEVAELKMLRFSLGVTRLNRHEHNIRGTGTYEGLGTELERPH